jgi:hypothetical protein
MSTTVGITGTIDIVKSLFQNALTTTNLYPSAVSSITYSDGTPRNIETDPIQYYISQDQHGNPGSEIGASLKAYIREYLYENLSSIIGSAATTGDIDIMFESQESLSNTIAAQVVQPVLFDQMYANASERFQSTIYMSSYSHPLPFQVNDTLIIRIRFNFPASLIQTPVSEHVLRIKNSNLFIALGTKIQVSRPTSMQQPSIPMTTDLPSCIVELRIVLAK